MSSLPTLPDGLELTRTTKVFDNDTAPAGLLKAHQVAEGVWARLVMHSGSAGFVFEDTPDELITVADGGNVVIRRSGSTTLFGRAGDLRRRVLPALSRGRGGSGDGDVLDRLARIAGPHRPRMIDIPII